MIRECHFDEGGVIRRELKARDRVFVSRIQDRSDLGNAAPAWSKWWRSFLRGAVPRYEDVGTGRLSIVDLFCGCGGLTLGVLDAARAVGFQPYVRVAVDTDGDGLAVYSSNFLPERILHADIASLVDFQIHGRAARARFAYLPEAVHRLLRTLRGDVNLVIAGPPCEGHSNLNNHTRRSDPRNLLYLDAVAVGVALDADAILLENVPDVVNDRSGVVDTAIALLESSGYRTTRAVLGAHELGFAQTRRRFFLVGSRHEVVDLESLAAMLAKPANDVRWAIEDLVDFTADPIMDSVPSLSTENKRRIDYLFENDLYELPDEVRPMCHRNGHSYPSVYGRLRWEAPAGTITTGFMTPGRGRFIHPSRRRPLTPREAARLQGFPDTFKFRSNTVMAVRKNALAKWIGDAVPPILGYTAALCVLPGFLTSRTAVASRTSTSPLAER